MQRGELETAFDLLFDGGIDDGAVGKVFAAVRHAVSGGGNFAQAADHAVVLVGQRVEDQVDADGMIGNALHEFEFGLPGRFVGQNAVGQTDAFHETFGEQFVLGLAAHPDQLIFDGRTAAVQYENNH